MFVPRWYQTEAKYSIFNYFANGGKGNPIIALPTGTGKGEVIADFTKDVFHYYPRSRIMMLTHVKKLIEQNALKLQRQWENAPIGIYSAGLKSRDTQLPIIFGGVQSVARQIERSIATGDRHFGKVDLLLIDEAHLLSPNDDTTYQFVIRALKTVNPFLKVIGFTATNWRMKQGLLTDEGLFTDTIYDLTTTEGFNRLLAEGYMSMLIPKHTHTQFDLSNVSVSAGDYNQGQLEKAVDKDEITNSAVLESIEFARDRRSWLFFGASIKHAEHIAGCLQYHGINAAVVHSKLPTALNDTRIKAFERGELRALVNKDMLTTGFDYPPIDFIGMMRSTLSPGLWVQMLGRGTRPSEETNKENCLCLDFAGNTKRLGPINDPVKPRKGGKGGGDAPIRICDACGVYNYAAARFCFSCGHEFAFETKILRTAGFDALIKTDAPIVEYFDVDRVYYQNHVKKDSNGIQLAPPSIKVSYFSGFRCFNEWVTLEHPGHAGKRARDWWRQRHTTEPPVTTDQALRLINELRCPKRIRVHVNKKYPEILLCEF